MIDWTGFATLTVGFVLTILGLQQSSNERWSSLIVLGPIVIGVVFGVFVLNELSIKRRAPLVEFSLFRDLRFAGASVVAFVGNWMFGVILFFLTLYLQHVLDLGPLTAGVVFLAFSVPLVAMSPVGGQLVSRFGSQDLMAVGMLLVGIGMVFFVLIDADSGIGLTLIGLPGAARSLVEEITDVAFTHALRYVMLLGVILSLLCIWPALWGRRKPVPARAHPTSAHPLWASLWRRHHPRVPAGSTPAR
jgi:Na+/melibiose symporter-like transporter